MGSIVKKIRKRVGKFNKAMSIVENNFKDIPETSVPDSFERFDLAATVKEEVEKGQESKRKIRNKKKATRRARRMA